ncbi:ATP-grasp domain-containing protein [Desulfobacula phenolica]|uniref:ATP-grasp domain-containing protein n=1 Tax=Desulfobacula phenolica TaxID=90732 RepID=A0A1H2DM99_9BACT|nr:ATP-grasp domain-containing protein [Desulfobacula phenolica]SDT83871.1 ATP-grasp domain-containing protein [Desulfobacula phenolica]
MFFVDKPYISEFFKTTLRDNAIPVVDTDMAKQLDLYGQTNMISEDEAVKIVQDNDDTIIYTTSENSIGWISKHLKFNCLPQKIALFKDKVKFRELTRSIFPDFYFKEVLIEDLKKIRFDQLPLPFIIKPSVGFFSMGVYKVSNYAQWGDTIESIFAQIEQIKDLYPQQVLSTRSFIIEQCIDGDEFAVDAYYNSIGEPVILGILNHTFSSDTDVSDRVYSSSKVIIENNLEEFTDFAGKIGKLAGVKKFPVHIELRRQTDGTLLPIEVNPMRFGGWCTTADLSFLAYGFNPYLYYYLQKKPDWHEVLKGKEGKLFSVVVLDNSTGIDVEDISSFDYDKLVSNFENPLELRKIDYKKYPVFGFLFTETREDNFIELKNILDSDLNEFISTNAKMA